MDDYEHKYATEGMLRSEENIDEVGSHLPPSYVVCSLRLQGVFDSLPSILPQNFCDYRCIPQDSTSLYEFRRLNSGCQPGYVTAWSVYKGLHILLQS